MCQSRRLGRTHCYGIAPSGLGRIAGRIGRAQDGSTVFESGIDGRQAYACAYAERAAFPDQLIGLDCVTQFFRDLHSPWKWASPEEKSELIATQPSHHVRLSQLARQRVRYIAQKGLACRMAPVLLTCLK